MTDLRYVTLSSKTPPITVRALLGQTPPTPSGGYGGWNEVPRPRRKAMSEWDGLPLRKQDVALIFDGFRARQSVEADIAQLERLARPAVDGLEPPAITVSGAVPHSDLLWVISDLDFDQQVVQRDRTGARIQQQVTVHLLEYVPFDELRTTNAASRARASAGTGKSNGKVHTVKRGETLSSIAASELGSGSRWPELAAANGIRDPNTIQPGQQVRLP